MRYPIGSQELHDTIVKMGEDISGLLIPFFRDIYNIKLEQPSFNTTINGYNSDGYTGSFTPIRPYGEIKLLQEDCYKEVTCDVIVAHELGHAAEFHNHPKFEDKGYNFLWQSEDYLLTCLQEGIAMDFEAEGTRHLLQNYFLRENSLFYNAWKRFDVARRFLGRTKAFTGKYAKGKRMVKHLKRKGVTIEEMLKNPEEFLPELKKEFK